MTTWSWSGWTEIPGGGQSSEGPAATFYNGKLYVFVHGYYTDGKFVDNHIYYNVFDGRNWAGWNEVPGNGTGYGSPAVAIHGDGKLYVVIWGVEYKIYYNAFDGSNWSGWAEVPGNGYTDSAPAAANVNGDTFVVIRGNNDNRIYYNVLTGNQSSGTEWRGWHEVRGDGRTENAPAVAAYDYKPIVLVTGTGAPPLPMYYNVAETYLTAVPSGFSEEFNWDGWVEIGGGGRCISPMAAKLFNNKLRVVVTGLQSGIYYNDLDANGNWSNWTQVPGHGAAESGPAVATTPDDSSLYIFVTGVGDRIYYNQLTFVASSTSTPTHPVTTGSPTSPPTGSSPTSSVVVRSEMHLSNVEGFGNLRVYGSGFNGGEEISISIESKSSASPPVVSTTPASTTATSGGGFDVTVAVPCPLGVMTTHSPTATGVTSGKTATGAGAIC